MERIDVFAFVLFFAVLAILAVEQAEIIYLLNKMVKTGVSGCSEAEKE